MNHPRMNVYECCNGDCNKPTWLTLIVDDEEDSSLVAYFCGWDCLQEWAFKQRDKMPKLSKSRTS